MARRPYENKTKLDLQMLSRNAFENIRKLEQAIADLQKQTPNHPRLKGLSELLIKQRSIIDEVKAEVITRNSPTAPRAAPVQQAQASEPSQFAKNRVRQAHLKEQQLINKAEQFIDKEKDRRLIEKMEESVAWEKSGQKDKKPNGYIPADKRAQLIEDIQQREKIRKAEVSSEEPRPRSPGQ